MMGKGGGEECKLEKMSDLPLKIPILVETHRLQSWSPLKIPSTEMPLFFMGALQRLFS